MGHTCKYDLLCKVAVLANFDSCVVDRHLCGEPCVHRDKKGCQGDCTQVSRFHEYRY
jgi:hypothetical protein